MRRASALALAIVVAGGTACDLTVGTLVVHLTTSPIATQDPLGGDVETVRIRVEAGDDGVYVDEFPFTPAGGAVLSGVPVGPDRVVEVQGLSSGGREVSRARSLPFDVGDESHRMDLFIADVSVFSSAAPPADPARAGTPRGGHDAVALGDGRVLLLGGAGSLEIVPGPEDGDPPSVVLGAPLGEVDLFDPTSGRVVDAGVSCPETVGTEPLCMRTPRQGAAVGTSTRGDVLIAGGADASGGGASQVERFGADRLWSEVVGGSMQGRREASFVSTPTGALIVGGLVGPGLDEPASSAVRLDRDGQPSAPVEALDCPRGGQASASVAGLVVLFGGLGDDGLREDFEVLRVDPLGSLGCSPLPAGVTAREGAEVAVVHEHFAVFVGGREADGSLSREVDVFDARTRTFCAVGRLTEPRFLHAVAPLPDDSVLVVGGLQQLDTAGATAHPGSTVVQLDLVLALLDAAAARGEPLACSRLEDQMGERSGPTPLYARVAPTATALGNGMVLLAGGFSANGGEPEELRAINGEVTSELLVP